ASVELVFDNTQGALGGEYARYNEISIKRVVNREGASVYYLNGTRCRRRDITDIFLGTGLGPRSYAIIEQGMITRLIEAKPEDMRAHLEEAAGISKYKERRRETENRIRHTRENLDRLNDLREEVDRHLEHLARQKRTAEKYKELKTEQRRKHAEVLALRWRDMASQLDEYERTLSSEQTRLEEIVAQQRRAEADIEAARQEHHDATEAFNEVQGRYYRVGAEISSTEQQIQHAQDQQQRSRDELAQVEREHGETAQHIRADRDRLEQLDAALAEDQPQHEQLKESRDASAQALEAAEAAMRQWQGEWDDFQARAAEPAQTAQVQRSRMEQLERHIEQARQRLQRIESERGELDTDSVAAEIDGLVAEEEAAAAEFSRLQGELDAISTDLDTARQDQQSARERLDAARGEQQSASARVTSLEALQQAALGQADEGVVAWLEQQGLSEQPRLAQQLRVEAGWERAVEVVLGPFLEAVSTDGLDAVAQALDGLASGGIALVDRAEAAQGASATGDLVDKVGGDVALAPLLRGVHRRG
ncbi:MAG: chromosome segregation protein SMC, partial [Proteobacteria bacterium SW_6_67_9]